MAATAAHGAEPRVAVFDFELVDTSLDGELKGPRDDEHERLLRISAQLREQLRQSGRFELLDMTRLNAAAHEKNLQACGGCDVQMAQEAGADLAITGTVQKISNLILNMTIYLRSTRTGRLVTTMNADFRGNTDESWSRAVSYLARNRLLAPNYGAPQLAQ
ncbi:DUF2380 domain-containing protein [Tardiphaga alba]|uniref:DUF2380 domain-containing protein n=1 Tax=Tardiphaga alba TaxID=340268 RepID=A0ABX8A3N8_9BRAD|nr:DUF3280 domain-containing protein [Tardiphaga alba]QUS38249.1 DUF2380 domain-containing protein [Tardiphaga alba]